MVVSGCVMVTKEALCMLVQGGDSSRRGGISGRGEVDAWPDGCVKL